MKVVFGTKSNRLEDTIFVSEEDFQMSFGFDSFKIPIDALNEIEKSSIMGKNIPNLLEFDDFSMWWFVHPTVYPKFKQAISFIIKFNEFIKNENPSHIKIENNFTFFDLIKQISNKSNIDFSYSTFGYLKFKLFYIFTNIFQKYRYRKITINKINKRMSKIKKNHDLSSFLRKKIIFVIPSTYRRHVTNLKTGKSDKGEYIQQGIIDLISKKDLLLGIDVDYTFQGDSNTLNERLNSEMNWIPLEYLIQKNFKLTIEQKNFLDNYKKIIKNNDFQKSFVFDDIHLWNHVKPAFEKMTFSPYLPFYLILYSSLVEIFKNTSPTAVFLPYETGPFALCFILAAKKFNVKTIGLAHAIISPKNPMYSYNRLRSDADFLGFPIPDFTLVFGNHSKKVLTDSGYPDNKIIPFGNAAFFNLDKYVDILKNKSLYEKYKIPENKKILLFPTEYLQEEYFKKYGKFNYDTQIWKYLLENFQNNDDWIVILKPHPTEKINVYEKILENYNAPNFKIIQDDLFELIYISTVVVSIFSHAMMDAICLKKPVIRVTFDNFKHVIPYDENDVVISTELNDLQYWIDEISSNQKIIKKLQKNQPDFIKLQYNIPEENPDKIINDLLD